jgi:hypothetical protein
MMNIRDFNNTVSMTKIFTILLLLGFCIKGSAQTLPVGLSETVEDAVRRQQLLGLDSTKNSYMIRPLGDVERYYTSEDAEKESFAGRFRKELFRSQTGSVAVYLLPLSWKNQYNTHNPYGLNDGSMILSKGYQTQLSGGVYAKFGPLSIQLRPEVVYAQNSDYRELVETGNPYVGLYKFIDLPSRFGNGSYAKVLFGQSNIKLTVNPVALSLSNENLWWGPGVNNSLLMSNNAAGFKHVSLNTSKPVNTPVGSFEAQIIGGRLDNSGYAIEGGDYEFKSPSWRYLSGVIVTYQPKWVPNLFLGFDRVFMVDRRDMGNGFSDYFPIFGSTLRESFTDSDENVAEAPEDEKRRDQYFSAFARWVLPESKAEVYFQFGRNDHPYDVRDAIVEPEHSSAYIAGIRKVIPLKEKDTYIQVGVEVTQMEGSNTANVRAQPIWYVHGQVVEGYTQQGQILGAGIGPGSNQQLIDVNYIKGFNRIGLKISHTNNGTNYASELDGVRQDWTDFAFAAKYDRTYKKIIFNSQLVYIRSKNYQYLYQSQGNVQFQIGALYAF